MIMALQIGSATQGNHENGQIAFYQSKLKFRGIITVEYSFNSLLRVHSLNLLFCFTSGALNEEKRKEIMHIHRPAFTIH